MDVEEDDGTRSFTALGQRCRFNEAGLKEARRWGGVNARLHGSAAGGLARTILLQGRRAAGLAAHGKQPLHHAVMLAVPAAARRKTGLGVGRKERRNQHPAEQNEERECDGAPHGSRRIRGAMGGESATAVTKAGNREQGTGSREQGAGSREQGAGNSYQLLAAS
jgi:hypothetical protein